MKLPSKQQIAATLLYYSGVVHVAGLFKRLLGRGGPIFLTGHRVLPASAARVDPVDQMALMSHHAITPEEMARRLRFVQRWLMPAGDPAELRGGMPRRRAFYLTFDDGYLDNVTHGTPVLSRMGIRAVMFVVADIVSKPCAAPWWDRWGAEELMNAANSETALRNYNRRAGRAKQAFTGLTAEDLADGGTRRYLTRAELEALPDTFYVANHTRGHANLVALGIEGRVEHIEKGESAIAKHPRRLPLLAYPFGSHDARLVDWLRGQATYSIAFATGGGVRLDPLRARRINMNLASFPLFAAQCAGFLD